MGRFSERLARMIAGDKRHAERADAWSEHMERPVDPMLTAVKITNRSDCGLRFVSTLEQNSDLEEAKFFREWFLKEGECATVPHHYWHVFSEKEGVNCTYQVEPAPRGSDFIYKRRVDAVNPHSRPEVSDSQI